MQVPLDTPVEVRAGKFREILDDEKADSYRALQESDEEFPEAFSALSLRTLIIRISLIRLIFRPNQSGSLG